MQAMISNKINDNRTLNDFEQLAYERKGSNPVRSAVDLGINWIDQNDKDSRKQLE